MKKILYTLLAGAMALSSCSKSDDMPAAPQTETTTFTLSVDESETRSTSTITPARYIMEVWSEDGTTAENVFGTGATATNHTEITSGSTFTVTLDKTKAYTCLFWADSDADNAAGSFNAASLKEISLNAGKDVTEAYFSKVAVAKGNNPAVAVTLKRAVAKITLTETATVKTTDDIAFKFTNIYPTFSVLDGEASGSATEWTKTIKPSATTGAIGTLYFFAKTDKELSDLTFTYAAEAQKTVRNIPVQQNFATNIKGEYSNVSSFTFTVTADNEWNTPSNEVEFPVKAKVGDFYYKDKTYSSRYTADANNPCIGIVFVVNADGKSGKIVGLAEQKDEKWSTETIVTGATSITDGADNTAKILALGTYSEAVYPAFTLVKSQNDANTTDGIKWYVPAIEELKALYGKYNGDTNVDASVKTAVNTSLGSVSGAARLSNIYWSSTENSMYVAWLVNFSNGITSNGNMKHNGSYRVRVVSAF